MSKPKVVLVTLDNKDVVLFVNSQLVLAQEAWEAGPSLDVGGKRLAAALGVELQCLQLEEPDKLDWTWEDVAALIPAAPSSMALDEIPVGTPGQLVTLDGRPVGRTVECLLGASNVVSATRNEDGSITLDYDAMGTEVSWDTAEQLQRDGQGVYTTGNGDEVLEGQLKLVPRATLR